MESSALIPVDPVSPLAPYIGGKKNLAKSLTAIIDRVPHTSYGEVFMGAGGIFLRRRRRPKAEAINDINGDLINLYRIAQRHAPALTAELDGLLTSRAEFRRLQRVDPTTLTDIERAARFLFLQRTAFGGKVVGQNFGMTPDRPAQFNPFKLRPMVLALRRRLADVKIEQLGYADFMLRYDRAGALLFLDPPYFNNEDDYGPGVFSADDFAAIADLCGALQGAFLMTINDRPEIRAIFDRFRLIELRTTYTIGGGAKARSAAELLVTNLPASIVPAAANDA